MLSFSSQKSVKNLSEFIGAAIIL